MDSSLIFLTRKSKPEGDPGNPSSAELGLGSLAWPLQTEGVTVQVCVCVCVCERVCTHVCTSVHARAACLHHHQQQGPLARRGLGGSQLTSQAGEWPRLPRGAPGWAPIPAREGGSWSLGSCC